MALTLKRRGYQVITLLSAYRRPEERVPTNTMGVVEKKYWGLGMQDAVCWIILQIELLRA